MLPAHERFHLGDAPGFHQHDRLVEDAQLAPVQRVAEVRLELQPRQGVGVHAGVEQDVPPLAAGLGAIHGDVGIAEQALAVMLAGFGQGDAQAGGDDEFAPVQREGLCEAAGDRLRQGHGIRFGGEVLQQHHELVAAEPGHGVAGPDAAAQPLRRLDQQPVARVVTQAVVDELEIVEVEEEQPDPLLEPAAAHQGLGEPVLEQRAVRQPGQAVIEGLLHELLLEALAFVHVMDGADDAADGRVLQQVREDELDIAPVAVVVANPQLGLAGAAIRLAQLVPELARHRLVLGMDEGEERLAEQLFRPVAPGRLGGRALDTAPAPSSGRSARDPMRSGSAPAGGARSGGWCGPPDPVRHAPGTGRRATPTRRTGRAPARMRRPAASRSSSSPALVRALAGRAWPGCDGRRRPP